MSTTVKVFDSSLEFEEVSTKSSAAADTSHMYVFLGFYLIRAFFCLALLRHFSI